MEIGEPTLGCGGKVSMKVVLEKLKDLLVAEVDC